jgi:hypothetical protein
MNAVMALQTKYLRLPTPVTLGSRFGDLASVLVGRLDPAPASFLVLVV